MLGAAHRHSPPSAWRGYVSGHDRIRRRRRTLDLIVARDRPAAGDRPRPVDAGRPPGRRLLPGLVPRSRRSPTSPATPTGSRNVLLAAANGGDGAFYDSQAARDADIEAGAGRRGRAEADVETSADHLLEAMAETPPEALDVQVPRLRLIDDPARQQMIPGRRVAVLRLREVVLHHVDLTPATPWPTLGRAAWRDREIGDRRAGSRTGPACLVDRRSDAGSWRYGRADGDAGHA